MNDNKARAISVCISRCAHVTCRIGGMCSATKFNSLLGKMPAWWDHLPDGGEARRGAFADMLGREMIRHLESRSAQQ